MNYGLILETPVPDKDFVLGGFGSLGGDVLQHDGQWDNWLPELEVQRVNGVESNACVSFATTNIVETLERRVYGFTANYSDRFLAQISGTKQHNGNSFHQVGETLRKSGCVRESNWPFDAVSYDEFYKDIPANLQTLAKEFIAAYRFGHEYVPSTPTALMEALKYSPVGFSVFAWTMDDDGYYYRPEGRRDTHAVMCYGYKEGKYWRVFDSYAGQDGGVLKKVAWDSLPMQAKRYTLHRQIVNESAFIKFVSLLKSILGL